MFSVFKSTTGKVAARGVIPLTLANRSRADGPVMAAGIFSACMAAALWALLSLAGCAGTAGSDSAQLSGDRITDMHSYGEKFAAIRVGDKYGYVDAKGRMVIEPQFTEVGDFSGGLAPVRLKQRWGVIDKKGRYVVIPRYEGLGQFSEGLMPVKDGGSWGFLAPPEKIAVKPQFDEVHPFVGGLAAVRKDAHWGFINKSGHVVINPRFAAVGDFHEGLAPASETGRRDSFGFISISGKWVVAPAFDAAGNFSQGLAPVFDDGQWGYADAKGRMAINPRFDDAGPFSSGLAAVCEKDKWGYIDAKGRTVVALQFDRAFEFSGPAALVVDDNGRGRYVDKTGKQSIQLTGAVEDKLGIAPPGVTWKNTIDFVFINETDRRVWLDFDNSFAMPALVLSGNRHRLDFDFLDWGYFGGVGPKEMAVVSFRDKKGRSFGWTWSRVDIVSFLCRYQPKRYTNGDHEFFNLQTAWTSSKDYYNDSEFVDHKRNTVYTWQNGYQADHSGWDRANRSVDTGGKDATHYTDAPEWGFYGGRMLVVLLLAPDNVDPDRKYSDQRVSSGRITWEKRVHQFLKESIGKLKYQDLRAIRGNFEGYGYGAYHAGKIPGPKFSLRAQYGGKNLKFLRSLKPGDTVRKGEPLASYNQNVPVIAAHDGNITDAWAHTGDSVTTGQMLISEKFNEMQQDGTGRTILATAPTDGQLTELTTSGKATKGQSVGSVFEKKSCQLSAPCTGKVVEVLKRNGDSLDTAEVILTIQTDE